MKMKRSTGGDFEFVSDRKLRLIDYLNIRHRTGRSTGDISRAASFLVDNKGRILWYHATDDYTVRPSPWKVLKAFDGMKR